MNATQGFLTLVGLSVGTLASGSSFAANGAASVSVDWSQLQISVTGVDGVVPEVIFSDQRTSLNSSANVPEQGSEYNSKSIHDWTSSIAANATATPDTFASTLANSTTFSASAQALDDGLYYWDTPGASSSGYRTESFSFDGPGVLTVTVPYTMSISGGDTYNYYDSTSASINARASFYGYENGGDFNSHSSASFHLNSFYDSSEQSQSGNLVFGIFAAGPGDGTLRIGMNTSAGGFVSGIPEPETYAMLLAGLGLMGAVVRRRDGNRNA